VSVSEASNIDHVHNQDILMLYTLVDCVMFSVHHLMVIGKVIPVIDLGDQNYP